MFSRYMAIGRHIYKIEYGNEVKKTKTKTKTQTQTRKTHAPHKPKTRHKAYKTSVFDFKILIIELINQQP